jgi:hypothetical protein
MLHAEHEVRFEHGSNEERQESLLGFLHDVDGHIGAIQEAARDRMLRQSAAGNGAPSEIRVEIATGPNADPGQATFDADLTPATVTVSYPCGKGPTGYIYCTVTYTETTGPVTVSP